MKNAIYITICILLMVSCRSTKKMEESTDVVSVADVRLLDSLKTSVSLSFDELDAWVYDDCDSLVSPRKLPVKRIRIRNGTLSREQERRTERVTHDSTAVHQHMEQTKANAPPEWHTPIIIILAIVLLFVIVTDRGN